MSRDSELSKPEIHWVLSGERTHPIRVAVAFALTDNTAACFAFTETGEGIVDLVGVQASPASSFDEASSAAQAFAKVIAYSPRRTSGMRTSDVRVLSHGPLLSRVHKALVNDNGVITARSWFGDGVRVINDRQTRGESRLRLARFVIAYQEVASTSTGSAQKAMAEREGVSVSAIRERLSRAKTAGLYATAGPGRLGQPTPEAHKIVDEAEGEHQ